MDGAYPFRSAWATNPTRHISASVLWRGQVNFGDGDTTEGAVWTDWFFGTQEVTPEPEPVTEIHSGRGKKPAGGHVAQHAGDFRAFLDKKRAEHRKSVEGAEIARAIELTGEIKTELKVKKPDKAELQRKGEALRELVADIAPLKTAMGELTQSLSAIGKQYAKAQKAKALEAAIEIERQLLDDEDAVIALLLS